MGVAWLFAEGLLAWGGVRRGVHGTSERLSCGRRNEGEKARGVCVRERRALVRVGTLGAIVIEVGLGVRVAIVMS